MSANAFDDGRFESSLKEALERHFSSLSEGRVPENLAESIRYSLLAPGKRIRPRLALACAEMIGLTPKAALPVAISLEMVHCFTLIHDDLPCMDNDDFRRGQPSNHKKFSEGLALLAGDALMALAIDAFMEARDHSPPADFIAALRRLCWAMGPRGVIGGQAAESRLSRDSTIDDLREMHARKTGALFSAALLIPKDLAGIADDSNEGLAIDHFGRELGLAFQVMDDIEDAPADPGPTNILYYLSRQDARTMAIQRLQAATLGLTSTWASGPGGTDALGFIARELIARFG